MSRWRRLVDVVTNRARFAAHMTRDEFLREWLKHRREGSNARKRPLPSRAVFDAPMPTARSMNYDAETDRLRARFADDECALRLEAAEHGVTITDDHGER